MIALLFNLLGITFSLPIAGVLSARVTKLSPCTSVCMPSVNVTLNGLVSLKGLVSLNGLVSLASFFFLFLSLNSLNFCKT